MGTFPPGNNLEDMTTVEGACIPVDYSVASNNNSKQLMAQGVLRFSHYNSLYIRQYNIIVLQYNNTITLAV